MVSVTVSDGNSRASWNTRPMPSAARRRPIASVTSRPARRMRPDVGARNPVQTSNSVVLPAPLLPMIPRISCGATWKRRVVERAHPAEAHRDAGRLQRRLAWRPPSVAVRASAGCVERRSEEDRAQQVVAAGELGGRAG